MVLNRSINIMLRVCEMFAASHDIIFSTEKSKCMLIQTCFASGRILTPPNIYLNGECLHYVDHFKYLGHYITENLKVDLDIDRELKSLSARGNCLVRNFGFLSIDVKVSPFKCLNGKVYLAVQ